MDVDPESMIIHRCACMDMDLLLIKMHMMMMHGYGLFAEKDPYQGWMHGHRFRIEDNACLWTFP